MNKIKLLKNKIDSLLLLAVFAGLAVCMTTLSAADDSFLRFPDLADLADGDVMLAPIGRRGAAVRLFVSVPGEETAAAFAPVNHGRWQTEPAESAVHLSLVIPW